MSDMAGRRRAVFAGIAVVILCGLTVNLRRSAACERRARDLHAKVGALRRAAVDELKIGSKKEGVIHFFAQNKVPLAFQESQSTGSILSSGCSPFGCGSDAAIILIKIGIDESGSFKSEPVVAAMYMDCL